MMNKKRPIINLKESCRLKVDRDGQVIEAVRIVNVWGCFSMCKRL